MRISLASLLLISIGNLYAGIVGKEVQYTADTVTMKGYLAYDDKLSDKRPGVLIVHEWWGNNEYTRKRAEMLAGLGYVALAVDMYGNGKQTSHPDDAEKFASEVMSSMPLMKARFLAAMNFLKMDRHVDPEQIAAIGYCFGGGIALTMMRDGADLKGVVSFHGSLASRSVAEKGKVRAKVLVCNGADDKFTTSDAIKKFKDEMTAAGIDFKFINYPGAIHGFTNPASTELGKKFNIAIAYNENADKKSWAEMEKFLRKVFKK